MNILYISIFTSYSNPLPNTLVHIALQTPLTRNIIPSSEIPWILLGTTIPDIPWIFQRICQHFPGINLLQLRLYCTAQASLFFSLILCLALACFAKKRGTTFLILALNSLFHLILDAMQIKWANGVHLFAPFSWHLSSFGFFWPDTLPVYLLSLLGFLLIFSLFPVIRREKVLFNRKPSVKIFLVALSLYFFLPFAFLAQLKKTNPSYVNTIQNVEERPGKYIELDRSIFDKEHSTIRLFTGEYVKATGSLPQTSGTVSLQGEFIASDTIQSAQFHFHTSNRDFTSELGLAAILLVWAYAIARQIKQS